LQTYCFPLKYGFKIDHKFSRIDAHGAALDSTLTIRLCPGR
jgi:hypothetical protein